MKRLLCGTLVLLIGGWAARPATAQAPTLEPATADEILQAVDENDVKIVILNVWATWCVPCREEFPDLVRVGKKFEDVDVVFVSADFKDQREKALAFLKKQGVTGVTYLKKGKDDAFVRTLSDEWTGALPATMIYDQERNLAHFWEGKSSYRELERRVAPLLAQ